MAFETLADLSDLCFGQLYAVYLAIARSDHDWRLRARYGQAAPPNGHAEFRPLSEEQFFDRLHRAQMIAGGEAMLRGRLARQAASYRVDITAELAELQRAA